MHTILCREYELIGDLVERSVDPLGNLAEPWATGKLVVVP